VKTGTKLGAVAFTLALGSAAVWMSLIRQVDIPEDRTVFVVLFLSAAVLGVVAFFKGTGWAGGFLAALAIFIGSFLPFTIAVSPQEVTSSVIKLGDTIPHFTAPDDSGDIFDSNSLHGHLVLIKFFRAHW
jgi:multisubunit Na+/H+ antiporter MnhB subunit